MYFQRRQYPKSLTNDQPYLVGLLTGLVTGITLGFLFAPRSGKDLRKQIAGTVKDRTKDVQRQWDKTKDQAKQTVDAIKINTGLVADEAEDEFGRYVDRARQQAQQAQKEAEEASKVADRLAKEAQSTLDKLKDRGRLGH